MGPDRFGGDPGSEIERGRRARGTGGRGAVSGRFRLTPVEPVLVTREEAARLLAMSLDHFERHVQPDLRLVRPGRKVLVPVRELHEWADRNAAQTLENAA